MRTTYIDIVDRVMTYAGANDGIPAQRIGVTSITQIPLPLDLLENTSLEVFAVDAKAYRRISTFYRHYLVFAEDGAVTRVEEYGNPGARLQAAFDEFTKLMGAKG